MQFIYSFMSLIINPKECSFLISSGKLAMCSDVWGSFTLITLWELPKSKTWNSLGTLRKHKPYLIDIIKFLESQKNKENLFEGYIPHQRFSSDYFFKLQRLKWKPKGDLSRKVFPHTMHSWPLNTVTPQNVRLTESRFHRTHTHLYAKVSIVTWMLWRTLECVRSKTEDVEYICEERKQWKAGNWYNSPWGKTSKCK